MLLQVFDHLHIPTMSAHTSQAVELGDFFCPVCICLVYIQSLLWGKKPVHPSHPPFLSAAPARQSPFAVCVLSGLQPSESLCLHHSSPFLYSLECLFSFCWYIFPSFSLILYCSSSFESGTHEPQTKEASSGLHFLSKKT